MEVKKDLKVRQMTKLHMKRVSSLRKCNKLLLFVVI